MSGELVLCIDDGFSATGCVDTHHQVQQTRAAEEPPGPGILR